MVCGQSQSSLINSTLPSTSGVQNEQGQMTSSLQAGKDKQYKCDRCLKWYSTQFSLSRHSKLCKGIENFNFCEHCGARFSKKMQVRFENHQKYCKVGQLKCGNCGVEYPRKQHANFIRHTQKCVYNKSCSICNTNFSVEEEYLKHYDICKWVCEKCGLTFPSDEFQEYNKHYKKCSKTIVCQLCGKTTFKNMAQYKLHFESCSQLDCKKCGKKFSSKQRQQYHIRNKVCEDRTLFSYQCTKCMHLFKFKKQLKAHKPKCTRDSKFYSCQFCNRQFLHKPALVSHIKACSKLDYYDVNIVSPSSSSDGTPSLPGSPGNPASQSPSQGMYLIIIQCHCLSL